MDELTQQLADQLWQAGTTLSPIAPLHGTAQATGLGTTIDAAYAIQRVNRDRRSRLGDRVIGRKIGLTSRSVQQQLGVNSPDFGSLWASTSFGDGDSIAMFTLIQPKVEAEIGLVLDHDVLSPMATAADLIRATAFALAALEIVDSRIADWKIGLFDTVADNASAAAFVLGGNPKDLRDLDLRNAAMTMTRNNEIVSNGIGSACLGHPINAAVWLARELARRGDPLRAGDIVLTGALGPMVSARQGDTFEARIDGLGEVAIHFT